MKKLLLLRGAMGAGKSTFIKEKNLEEYTISSDQIRLMMRGPVLCENGEFTISQKDNNKAWELLFKIVEKRMSTGEFIVVDAMHLLESEIRRYKKLAEKYRYRVYIIDFTGVPKGILLERNKRRKGYKKVKEKAIEIACRRIEEGKIPGFVKIIPYKKADEVINLTPIDFSNYKKIHHIGDIHGCYEPLIEYFKDGLKEDELYIFLGDFIDRGLQNAEVLNFLISIMDRPNVIFLEGNHEKWLWMWANGEKAYSEIFETKTRKELEEKGIDKKSVRELYRKTRNLVYYIYYNKKILVSHGGLSSLPENLNLISSEQIIKGVGDYEIDIDEKFFENVPNKDIIQIHGHRNLYDKPIQASCNSFNLEGRVEFGGNFRIITVEKKDKEVIFSPVEIKNNLFRLPENMQILADVKSMVKILRKDEFVFERKFDNISSFNFSPHAFFNKKWDYKTIKARGLFINTDTYEIVARSYEKFFRIDERKETMLENLKNNMKFPAVAYVKEDGFLGIVGVDQNSNNLVFASKSMLNNDYAKWLKEQFMNITGIENAARIKRYLIKENISLVFEVIEPENDPHIIKYPYRKLVLLDMIKRTPKFEKLSYGETRKFAEKFGFCHKKTGARFTSWDKFIKWYQGVTKEDFKFNNKNIEGFVIEDSTGLMVKLKTYYYDTWKYIETIKEKIEREKEIKLKNSEEKVITDFAKIFQNLSKEELKLDIIKLRDKYFTS